MIETMLSAFQQQYKTMPEIRVKAPGRINLIGEHTDYNLGFVLPAAIDKYTYFLCSQNHTNHISISSADFEEVHIFNTNISAVTSNGWQKYTEATMLVLKQQGYSVKGFNMLITSNIPIGAGLSSSASLICGIILSLSKLNSFHIPKVDIALMAQQVENLIGLNCGLMDQYAVLQSIPKHCLFMDCRDLTFEFLPADFKNCTIVLLDSMVKHDLAASGYNDRRLDIETAINMIQQTKPDVKSPRDLTFEMLETDQVTTTCKQRLRFVLQENQRVLDTCEALKSGDMNKVGELMNASHDGLRVQYEVSCAELDFLADFAQKKDYVLGSRMMGGGFGGYTINLVKKGCEKQLIDEITVAYKVKTGKQLTSFMLSIGEGAREI